MSNIKLNVAFIGPWPAILPSYGYQVFSHWSQGQNALKKDVPAVLGLNLTTLLEKNFQKYLSELQKVNPNLSMIVVVPPEIPAKELAAMRRLFPVTFILNKYDDSQLLNYVHRALEIHRWKGHFHDLTKMREHHFENLEKLQSDLKIKIEKREKALLDLRDKAIEKNYWADLLRQVIEASVKSDSLEQLASELNLILGGPFQSQIQIILGSEVDDCTWKEELKDNQDQVMGYLTMSSVTKKKPTVREKKFLREVIECVGLTVLRIERSKQLKQLQREWNKTFQAIENPLLLINEKYDIIQSNRTEPKVSAKCFQLLFARTSPCEGCHLGTKFTVTNGDQTVVVRGKPLSDQLSNQQSGSHYLHTYEDVTEKLKMERNILAASSFAEMGTVAGSIAHELNNPLAGIISFLQLIKSDLQSEEQKSPIIDDIEAMEKAAQKSKKIIEGLLDYVRRPVNQ